MTRAVLGSLRAPTETLIADFTDGTWELTELGSGTLQYDAGSSGSFATGRSYSVDEVDGLKIAFDSATNGQYAAVSYIPASPLALPDAKQIVLEVEFEVWAYYTSLNLFIVTQNGNTFTNYFNKAVGDTQQKVPLRQALVFNIDRMTATSGGANMSSIGKLHFRLQQSTAGSTATQPGLIHVRKAWWR